MRAITANRFLGDLLGGEPQHREAPCLERGILARSLSKLALPRWNP